MSKGSKEGWCKSYLMEKHIRIGAFVVRVVVIKSRWLWMSKEKNWVLSRIVYTLSLWGHYIFISCFIGRSILIFIYKYTSLYMKIIIHSCWDWRVEIGLIMLLSSTPVLKPIERSTQALERRSKYLLHWQEFWIAVQGSDL